MLTIEDGSIVPDAESFATLAELRTRAGARGDVLPAEDAACEALLRRAAEAMAPLPWRGRRVSPLQPLCWPRADVHSVGVDAIPLAVKQAQCALAVELQWEDAHPLPPPGVIRERVDVLEVEYASGAHKHRRGVSSALAAPYLRGPAGVVRA